MTETEAFDKATREIDRIGEEAVERAGRLVLAQGGTDEEAESAKELQRQMLADWRAENIGRIRRIIANPSLPNHELH